ncbi:MAG: prepilin peptidase [Pirellulaceae bacterium]
MSDVCLDAPANPSLGAARKLAWLTAFVAPALLVVAAAAAPSTFPSTSPLSPWQTASGMLLFALVATVSVTDLRWHTIPNWATYPAFAWAIVINGLAAVTNKAVIDRLGAVGLSDSLLGAFLPFFFMLVIFSMTGGGAGDVKLTAALGALLGLDRAIQAILLSFIWAGGFALIRAIWVQGPVRLAGVAYRVVGHALTPLWVPPPSAEQRALLRQPMPLGPSFALGTSMVLFDWDVEQLLEWVPSWLSGA